MSAQDLAQFQQKFRAVFINELVTDQDKLALWDETLSELETPAVFPQVVPQVVDQVANTLHQNHQGRTLAKETVSSASATEVGAAASYVEIEPQAEIMPEEVSEYLTEVEDHEKQVPHEVVIKDDGTLTGLPPVLSQKVVVVPINPQLINQARFKSPKFSLKWLVEWSHKIIKMFTGKVIYQEAEMS